MAQSEFGRVLKTERERLGLSLRQLALSAALNPGYISRLESGEVTPREENLVKIADALATRTDDKLETREGIRARLAEAAGRVPGPPEAIKQVKRDFAARLEAEGFEQEQINAALEKVSLPTMVRVVRGEEPLEWLPIDQLDDPEATLNLDQEIVSIPDLKNEFRAGNRAVISVRGPLRPDQRVQLGLIAQLIQTVVAPPGS